MQKPLISILMPFKNTAKYIQACIISIQEQSYQNWELVAVNDHATDNSLEIMQALAKNDSRIKIFTNKGNGIIPALQLAFSKSKGIYISRMDADDLMPTKKLEVLQAKLAEKGNGFVATGLVKYFSEAGISDGYQKYEAWLNSLTKKGENYQELYKECVIPSPCWMVSREDFIKCGAFDADRYPEDYDLTFRFYQHRLKCIPADEILHLWRDYAERTSRTHIHYAQNYFLDIKLYYFLKLHHDKQRPLTIWGAGFKGKTIAKKLIETAIPFYWICDNPNKIGRVIYNQKMHAFSFLRILSQPQCIITVANGEAQKEIKKYLYQHDFKPMRDYFFFC